MSAEIHTLDTSSPLTEAQYRALINDINDDLRETLSNLLGHMFEHADDTLFRLAESAESNEDQSRYFDTMRLLRMERQNINKLFADALGEFLHRKTDDREGDPSDDELSLVAQEEMEELVAISTMQSNAASAFGDGINHLQARLEVLSTKYPDCIDKQAVTPKNICQAFQHALDYIGLDIENRLVVYRLFDQEVCSQLDVLYRSLNKLLIDAGILPQIKLDNSLTRHSTTTVILNKPDQVLDSHRSPSVDDQDPAGVDGTGMSRNPGLAGAEISRVVSQILNGEVIARGPGIPVSFSTGPVEPVSNKDQYYDRRDVLRALSSLQANFIQHDEVTDFVDAETFKRALMIDMGSRHGGTLTRRVNLVDEKTIDFIEMLFQVILEDAGISELATNLLLRLQIPVIKAAMLDTQLFSSSDHPARRVLNLVGEAGRSIDDRNDQRYLQLETIIDQLLEEFDVDIKSFETAADQLNELLDHEQKIIEENEQHTQKQVLQDHGRQIILAELQHIMSRRRLPKAVYPLVLKHWSTLMFRRYIRYGKASDEWNQALSLLKRLLNSLQPIASRSQWRQLEQSRFSLISHIKEAFHDSNQDKVKINEALEALSSTYQLQLDASPFRMQLSEEADQACLLDDTWAFDALPDVAAECFDTSPLERQQEQAREKISRLPSEVRPGAWFNVYDGPDRPKRCLKLSVILMEEARLIFVDRLGIKVLEKEVANFTEEIRDGRSGTIAHHSLFDHALSQVIDCLEAAG